LALIDRRIGVLFIAFVALLGIALARAVYLGSVRSGSLARAAATQQVSNVTVPAARGAITDRDGAELAISESADDVVATVRSARAGETLLPRSVIIGIAQRVAIARDRLPERPPIEALTARELQVLQALAEGLATPDICETLFISRNTLRTHVQNIMMKLHVHSKLEAVTVGLRNRIIDPPRPDDRSY